MNYLLSALSGILLALAFPKFDLWWLAWVALAPFFFALNGAKSWRNALLCGLIFGLVFFGIDLFWVTSLTRFVGWWALPGWISLTIFQSLFPVLLSTLYFLLSAFFPRFPKPLTIVILWVIFEWFRGLGPFGVTAGVVGYSQSTFLPLIQIASFTTVYGVSFVVVLTNAVFAELFRKPATERRGFLLELLVIPILTVVYGFYVINSSFPVPSPPDRLALIQPNIDQMDKMNPRLVPTVFGIHEVMSRAAAKESPEIIVWPETAVFSYLLRDPVLLPRVKELARESGAWLVVGTPHYDGGGEIYNSMVAISPSGEIGARYDKERLVPFGEYLPFRSLLYPILKATTYYEDDFKPNHKPQTITAGRYKIAPAICFESTFPDVIRKRVEKDTDFILTITNDVWFGASAAPYFHLNTGVFRAIENRKYFVQVGNSGFSAVIDPYGRVLKKSRLNTREIISL